MGLSDTASPHDIAWHGMAVSHYLIEISRVNYNFSLLLTKTNVNAFSHTYMNVSVSVCMAAVYVDIP